MELKLDIEQYEHKQQVFITEIIEIIRVKLMESGLQADTVHDLTAGISMSIASIIDDTSGLESDGVNVKPFLGFRSNDDENEIIHCGENSYTYEYVYGILRNKFKAE